MVDGERERKKKKSRAPIDDIASNPEDAQQYSSSDGEGSDCGDDSGRGSDRDRDSDESVTAALQRRRLQALNTSYLHVTGHISDDAQLLANTTFHRGHKATPTASAITDSGALAYTGCKAGSLLVWDVANRAKLGKLNVGCGIVCIDVNEKLGHVAVGCTDGKCYVYDVRGFSTKTKSPTKPIQTLSGHKSPLSSVVYTATTLTTASLDRCLRTYSPTANYAYTETLYGHQDGITAIAGCIGSDNVVSCGRDRTVRLWNVAANSHGIYRPGAVGGSGDCVAAMDKKCIVEGGDDGCLRLWEIGRKKPVATEKDAHGQGKWLVSAQGAKGRESDCIVTGSWDGVVKVWKVIGRSADGSKKDEFEGGAKVGFNLVRTIRVEGYINSISIDANGRTAVIAVGREHRLGRWAVVKGGGKLDRVVFVELFEKGIGQVEGEKALLENDGEENASSGDEDESDESGSDSDE
jgi:ribosomal RNA-processing protein 9